MILDRDDLGGVHGWISIYRKCDLGENLSCVGSRLDLDGVR